MLLRQRRGEIDTERDRYKYIKEEEDDRANNEYKTEIENNRIVFSNQFVGIK